MSSIYIIPVFVNRRERMAIRVEGPASVERKVKQLPQARWNAERNCWHIPMNRASYAALVETIGHEAVVDTSQLRIYLERRKLIQRTLVPGKDETPMEQWQETYGGLLEGNLEQLANMIMMLEAKAYSRSTLITYRAEFLQYIRDLGERSVLEIHPPDIVQYIRYLLVQRKMTEATVHSRLNAIKFYYEQVLRREKFFVEIPRPKKPIQLPKVLGETELHRLFAAVGNLKHKAILFCAYSAGMRVSEVVQLRMRDIDSDRMQIFISRAKGKKDRYVGLSILLLDILRSYYRSCKPKPLEYIFEGDEPGKPLSARTAQVIFQRARVKAGISKQVSFHALRHSFATHLLEKGVDIHYIKELLGHFDIKTTERYLHVKRESLVRIPNPLDEIFKDKEWGV
jgi:integrase/recombinase XerD